jgi:protein-tyrosine-phosphatase/predicted ATP-grasp superfamily ATP-dependent carboligase
MMAPSRKVLVLGNDTRSFLSVIRSLGRRGLSVHVGWCDADAPAVRSRYVSIVHQLPAYAARNDDWKRALRELLEHEGFDLVIPCDEPRIIPLQANRRQLEQVGRIYLLHDRAFEISSSKLQSTALAASLGIPVPQGGLATSISEAEVLLDDLAMPVFLKPLTSFSGDDRLQRNSVRKAYSRQEARWALEEMFSRGHVLLQENFSGRGVGIEILAKAGRVLTAFQHVRVHEPLHGGGSSYRRSAPLDPQLLDATRKLTEALCYTGVGMFEFKVDPRSRRWVFMEINGRFWGSLPLALAAGADFPWYLYQMLVLGQETFLSRFATDLYCRNLVSDLAWLRWNCRADPKDSTLNRVPLHKVMSEVKNIVLLRERSDTFAMDDLAPAFADLCQGVELMWSGVFPQIQARMLSLPGVRSWARWRARSALASARRVLFICRGNICRSPFAEQFARSLFGERIVVSSAGFFPKEGRTSPDNAMQAARELGVDLSRHRSRVLTAQDVAQADAIFVFDPMNLSDLLKAFPGARQRVHFLGALGVDGAVAIPDPWGSSLDSFSQTYHRIAGTLRQCEADVGAVRRAARSRTGRLWPI